MSDVIDATSKAIEVEIRPGVLRPDWSVVTSKIARDALCARSASRSSLVEGWAVALDSSEDRAWQRVLALFVELGRAPSIAEIAADTGLEEETAKSILKHLQSRDLLRLGENGGIIDAYPFTERATGHVVKLGCHKLNALCAIDALGAGAMCGRDVAVESTCRACGMAIRIATANQGARIATVSPAGTVVWHDTFYSGSAASSCCPRTAFFCSDAHLNDWLSASDERSGRRLSADEALQVGRAIFGPVLAKA
ncbi:MULTISPECIES: alkylmercury lyase family protein [Aurantimonadaceae]|uniref:Organomercurial lyase n=1 Tax=Jiella pelagia TaxID=2986949 RepID=A0ABY7C628_9HYPH|nr:MULTISPECIES: organomercurial lyase [Aurantimonadaceae]ORE97019.1 organomercurial lyase [Aurantimonas sp. 22II-16-19i]WAP71409.1 organomercurial lyase [Jiella pelagia]